MVFESLIRSEVAQKKAYMMIPIGILYSSLGILLSLWLFRAYASLVMVFITVLPCTHIMYSVINKEGKKHLLRSHTDHTSALELFMFLFLGLVIGFSLWYLFMPLHMVSSTFDVQLGTIQGINSNPTGKVIAPQDAFSDILYFNGRLLLFCFFFAFAFAMGGIFILVWNASVIGTALGSFVRNSSHAGTWAIVGVYFGRLLGYAAHGTFEILAYFMAGIAGGILSYSLIKREYHHPTLFKKALLDTGRLFLLALALLLFAAFIEVFFTPLLFL